MRVQERAEMLTGRALPVRAAREIGREAEAYADRNATPENRDRVRDSFCRGAVAGYTGGARAISDSPMAIAHRAGHHFGVKIRRAEIPQLSPAA